MSIARRIARTLAAPTILCATLVACAAEPAPSVGSYTLQFPSTPAAIATDTVQIFVFDVAPPNDATRICEKLIAARTRGEPLHPVVVNEPVNICALLRGARPITVPYGEKAVLAVAVRKGTDFMMGCVVETFGAGDAPIPIPLVLTDSQAVPDTVCKSVGDFCSRACQAN
jgi:hypothetical protein